MSQAAVLVMETSNAPSGWTTQTRLKETNSSVLMSLSRCCSTSCVPAALRHGAPVWTRALLTDHSSPAAPSCDVAYRADREWKTTQVLRSGTKRLYGAAEQPSTHVSGSVSCTGFVGHKIWVYVCTYNIWQQGGIHIQLHWMLFAWVTVWAAGSAPVAFVTECFSVQMDTFQIQSLNGFCHSEMPFTCYLLADQGSLHMAVSRQSR